jgi:hypothetical protein
MTTIVRKAIQGDEQTLLTPQHQNYHRRDATPKPTTFLLTVIGDKIIIKNHDDDDDRNSA